MWPDLLQRCRTPEPQKVLPGVLGEVPARGGVLGRVLSGRCSGGCSGGCSGPIFSAKTRRTSTLPSTLPSTPPSTLPSTPPRAGTSPSTPGSTFWGSGVRHLCSRSGHTTHLNMRIMCQGFSLGAKKPINTKTRKTFF